MCYRMEEPSEAAAAVKGTTDGLKLGDMEEKGAVSALEGEEEKTYYVSYLFPACSFTCVLSWCHQRLPATCCGNAVYQATCVRVRVLVLLDSVCCKWFGAHERCWRCCFSRDTVVECDHAPIY